MSHQIDVSYNGEKILSLNVSGDLSAFYSHFDCENCHGPSGDDSFTATLENINNFLDTPYGGDTPVNNAEFILRSELDNLNVLYGADDVFSFLCY